MSDPDFEEQLRLEAVEKAKKSGEDGRTKVDPDGTVYEWDSEKKAWFPKIDADFIAKYQMNYGNFEGTEDKAVTTPSQPSCKAPTPSTTAAAPLSTASTTPSEVDAYWKYYHDYYSQAGQQPKDGQSAVSSTSGDAAQKSDYDDYYKYYYHHYYQHHYGNTDAGGPDSTSHKTDKHNPDSQTQESGLEGDVESKTCESTTGSEEAGESSNVDSTSQEYYDYWSYYYNYYNTSGEHGESEDHTGTQEQHAGESSEIKPEQETSEKAKDKEGKKRAATKDEGWFQLQQDHNTQVYVCGMPEDISDNEFKEMMEKCGLIMHNPITRKEKLKLYKDHNGVPKGDGLCCYIKMESVELALQIVDGAVLRGNTIRAEKATFQMKGNYDPAKKRRKLTKKKKVPTATLR